jgi:hypothetical protein
MQSVQIFLHFFQIIMLSRLQSLVFLWTWLHVFSEQRSLTCNPKKATAWQEIMKERLVLSVNSSSFQGDIL